MKNTLLLIGLIAILFSSCSNENEVKPEACFDWEASANKAGEEFQFTNCSKNASCSYWIFGDGETSTEKEPVHIFKKQGTYEIILFTGEDKDMDGILNSNDDADSVKQTIVIEPNHLTAELTILSVSNWTPENPAPTPVPGATIKFFKEYPVSLESAVPDYTLTSDANGKVLIYDQDVIAVCFVTEKEEESNIVNGFLFDGVFQTQEEVDNWAYIEGATVGSYKYIDISENGTVDTDDKVIFDKITLTSEDTFVKNVYIGK